MLIVAIIAIVAGIAGVALTVKEVHEVTEDISESGAFPLVGIALAVVALAFFVRAAKS